LLASIGGIPVYRDHNILDELVRRSLALVIDRNLIASADRYGSPQYGSHLERYLVDALRRLARGNSAWVPNRERSRLWFGQDGLFLVWPGAADDVHQLLEADQLAGIPKAPETMLELLLAAGVFEAAVAGHPIWSIQPPGAKVPLEAVKLSAPDILLAGIDPHPVALPQALEFKPERASAPTVPQRPESGPPPAPPVKSGTQLSLIPPPEPTVDNQASAAPLEATPRPSSPEPVSPPSPATFALQAPMRLNPVVRDALADAVRTLNDGMGPSTVCTIAQGVFVPLVEFERRGIQPSLAMRALTEANMLITPNRDGPPTLSRDFNGNPTAGIVLDPCCVSGLDLAGFAVPTAEEG
ncbi:TraI domain-containing protein, partial [Zoogloea sp.]|uniref:TraI domain-containing protein n=1 Tax=Zoogloea sp. TaxID=49181 RepID=UPI0035AEB442